MIKVLVTGANGQLGLTLRDLADKYEDDFIFIFMGREELDINSSNNVSAILMNNDYDYCINCAAYTNVELAENNKDEAFKINSKGVRNLAFFCDYYDITLIHISTDYVFDGHKNKPYAENDKIGPLNIYGESKLHGENYIKMLMENYYIIRTSWLYSPYKTNFFNTVVNYLNENRKMKVATNQVGSPTSTYILGEGLIHLMLNDTKEYGIYHFSNKGITTWYGLATEIGNLYNSDLISSVESYPTIAKRPLYSVLDSNKFEITFNYEIPNWKESLNEVYEIKNILK